MIDTTDSILMLGAYGWAFVKPIRKLYYNLTITAVSVIVAVVVGGLETLNLIGGQLGLTDGGGFWGAIGSLNDNLGVFRVRDRRNLHRRVADLLFGVSGQSVRRDRGIGGIIWRRRPSLASPQMDAARKRCVGLTNLPPRRPIVRVRRRAVASRGPLRHPQVRIIPDEAAGREFEQSLIADARRLIPIGVSAAPIIDLRQLGQGSRVCVKPSDVQSNQIRFPRSRRDAVVADWSRA